MYIQLNGQVLYYEKAGEGSPLILLHGNGESHEIFAESMERLAAGHTVYAIDSRGQGLSATPKEFHYADMAQDVVNFIQSLEIEHPAIYGFSDGGIVALLVAMAHSDLLSCLMVSGVNLSPKGLCGSARREIKSIFRKNKSPLTEMMLLEPSIEEKDLAAISVPTLILAGEKDMVKPKETKKIAAAIPGASLTILPGEDHGSYVIHSDKLAPLLLDFMKSC